MKLASAIVFATLGFSAFALGVGCASGTSDSANPANVTMGTPSPVVNPDNSEYGDDDGTTVSGARPDPKSTTPIGFASQATGDDDDTTTSTTTTTTGGDDAGVHLILNAGSATTDAGTASTSSSSSSSSSGSTGTSSSSSSSSSGSTTSTACTATTSCSTSTKATDLGYVSGDDGADVVNATGTTSHWFKVIVGEDTDLDIPLYMTATLTSPAGSNFDLYVYTTSCGTPTKFSAAATGNDVVPISIPASTGDSYAVIEVRAVTTTCSADAKWSLKVEGNK